MYAPSFQYLQLSRWTHILCSLLAHCVITISETTGTSTCSTTTTTSIINTTSTTTTTITTGTKGTSGGNTSSNKSLVYRAVEKVVNANARAASARVSAAAVEELDLFLHSLNKFHFFK